MTEEMKLTELAEGAFSMPAAYEKIWKILYAVDPAVLRRLKGDKLIQLTTVNINYRINVVQTEIDTLNAQIAAKKAEIDAYNQLMDVIG